MCVCVCVCVYFIGGRVVSSGCSRGDIICWHCHTIVYQLDWLVVLCAVFIFVGDHVIDFGYFR